MQYLSAEGYSYEYDHVSDADLIRSVLLNDATALDIHAEVCADNGAQERIGLLIETADICLNVHNANSVTAPFPFVS